MPYSLLSLVLSAYKAMPRCLVMLINWECPWGWSIPPRLRQMPKCFPYYKEIWPLKIIIPELWKIGGRIKYKGRYQFIPPTQFCICSYAV